MKYTEPMTLMLIEQAEAKCSPGEQPEDYLEGAAARRIEHLKAMVLAAEKEAAALKLEP